MRFATHWLTFCSGPAKFALKSLITSECILVMKASEELTKARAAVEAKRKGLNPSFSSVRY